MRFAKKTLLAAALLVMAASVNVLPALASKQGSAPEMGDTVPVEDLVIKFLALPEFEPTRYTKQNGGKFAPEEIEKGLLIGVDMKYGPGNPDGMMAPLKHSFADITADLEFDTGTGEIVITYNDLVLEMEEGSQDAVLTKNGNQEQLTIPEDLEPYFLEIEGETDADGSPYTVCYLPVRFTAEALGANVTWDESMHRLVMAFAFYYSDAAIQPIINSKSPYTTKMLESNPTSWSTIASIASSSNAAKKKELITAALNVVNPAYQNEDGGWGKTNTDYDLLEDSFSRLYGHAYSTFDNGATHGQIKFLSRILRAAKEDPNSFRGYEDELETIEDGFWKSMDYMINSQNEAGGWPQYYPYGVGYFKLITFNDNAMTSVMQLVYALTHEDGLIDSSLCEDFGWVRKALTDDTPDKHNITIENLNAMWDKALDCTLKLQITVDGELTAWAQQYDPETGEPTIGRAFELPSICTSESQAIMNLLTNITEPSEAVKTAITSYAHWTEEIGIEGYESINISDRTRELGKDRRYVYTGTTKKTYGRFYGLDKDGSSYDSIDDVEGFYPIYSGRDSIAKLDHNVGGHERRSGYSFVQTDIEKKANDQLKKWEKALESYEKKQLELDSKSKTAKPATGSNAEKKEETVPVATGSNADGGKN